MPAAKHGSRMTCPRCGLPDVTAPACPRCGVVFAKLHAPPSRPPASRPPVPPPEPDDDEPSGSGRRLLLDFALVAAAVALAVWLYRNPPRLSGRSSLPRVDPLSSASPAPLSTPGFELPPLDLALPATPAPSSTPFKAETGGVSPADADRANALLDRLRSRSPLGPAELKDAEDLYARYPGQASLKTFLEEIFLGAAIQEQAQRRHGRAALYLRRALELLPDRLRLRSALVSVLLEANDWPGAEAAARDLLALSPRDFDALKSLGFALFRQDRNREAAEALRAALAVREESATRNLLETVLRGLTAEKGMTEQKLAHFHVRYDGETHEDVGREILRLLERHYAALVRAFDHEPGATIPVILFSQQSYHDATGAPAWSGGQYTDFDGRIRLPIGGLTSALSPDMDGVLVHELTHAFITDRSHGVAPRELHEGLAQYMEGRRTGPALTAEEVRAMAEGRPQPVGGFYLASLSLAEYLLALRGQGGVNDLLKAMGETGDASEAFRRVYGKDYAALRADWAERFR